jgi:type IV secretion system protein VirB9
MQKLFISSVLVLSGLSAGIAIAASNPHRIAADSHIKVVQYDPNNVVLLNGQYGYQTQITFAPNEVVQNVSLGDSIAWQAVPVGNNLFIKPIASSKTNMTVLTNANSYNFQLDSQQQDGTGNTVIRVMPASRQFQRLIMVNLLSLNSRMVELVACLQSLLLISTAMKRW